MEYYIVLKSDIDWFRYSQYSSSAKIEELSKKINKNKIKINSFKEASTLVRKFIDENNLGASNFPETFVYKGNEKIARISYNGRVWKLSGDEITDLDFFNIN
jgi:hypothetical protein